MLRKAFVMTLKPGFKIQYERRHNPIWPELADVLRNHGVSKYSIFFEEDTHKLFAYAEIESEDRWLAIANTGVCQKWWKYMKDLMETNDDCSPKTVVLTEVFFLK
jgi:L-rhamnose mutarotase